MKRAFFNIFGAVILVILLVWYLLQTFFLPQKVADSNEWPERHAIESKNKDFFVVDHYSNFLDQDSAVFDQHSTGVDQNSTVLDQNYSNQNSSRSPNATSNWSIIHHNDQGTGSAPTVLEEIEEIEEKSRCDKSCPPKYTLSTDCKFCFLIGQWLSNGGLVPLTGSVQ